MERASPYVSSAMSAWLEALHAERRSNSVYKPALLLAVLDLLDEGVVDPNRVAPDERLARDYDALLAHARLDVPRGAVWQPFFHLGTGSTGRRPIWTLHDPSGVPLRVTHQDTPGSLVALRRRVSFAAFAPELAASLRAATDRELVRSLVYEWLERRPDADALWLLHAHDRDWPLVERSMSLVREATERPFELHVPRPYVELSDRARRARDRGFRSLVVPQYEHRCAACELRLQWGGLYEAEAAHIVPVSADGADDVRNALSLCRTHHWAFDLGLWTVGNDLRITVVDAADGDGVDLAALRPMRGRELLAPHSPRTAPHPDALAWHRKHRFLRGAHAA